VTKEFLGFMFPLTIGSVLFFVCVCVCVCEMNECNVKLKIALKIWKMSAEDSLKYGIT